MSFVAVSAGVGAASLGVGLYKSIKQNSEANGIDKNNPRPSYTIPDEYKQNVLAAQNMARVGLPSQQYNDQQNAINRNQAGGLGALSRTPNVGGVASVVRQSNDANNHLNAQDAVARQNNERYAIGQNAQLGAQKLAQQQYNKFDKYTEDYNKAAALRGASNQNLQGAFNGAGQLATNLYGYGQMNSSQPQTSTPQPTLAGTNASFNNYLNGQRQPSGFMGLGASAFSTNPLNPNYREDDSNNGVYLGTL